MRWLAGGLAFAAIVLGLELKNSEVSLKLDPQQKEHLRFRGTEHHLGQIGKFSDYRVHVSGDRFTIHKNISETLDNILDFDLRDGSQVDTWVVVRGEKVHSGMHDNDIFSYWAMVHTLAELRAAVTPNEETMRLELLLRSGMAKHPDFVLARSGDHVEAAAMLDEHVHYKEWYAAKLIYRQLIVEDAHRMALLMSESASDNKTVLYEFKDLPQFATACQALKRHHPYTLLKMLTYEEKGDVEDIMVKKMHIDVVNILRHHPADWKIIANYAENNPKERLDFLGVVSAREMTELLSYLKKGRDFGVLDLSEDQLQLPTFLRFYIDDNPQQAGILAREHSELYEKAISTLAKLGRFAEAVGKDAEFYEEGHYVLNNFFQTSLREK